MGRPKTASAILCMLSVLYLVGCDDAAGAVDDAGPSSDVSAPDGQLVDGVAPGPDAAPDAGPTQITDPAEPGTHTASTSTASVTIGSDTIPLTLYLPDGAGPFPVIVFTHGFGLSPSLYDSYGVHLASWGYVVIMPQMPGSMLSPTVHRVLKELLRSMLDWVDTEGPDPGGVFGGRVDPALLGLAGHSMGGKISLLVSTEDSRPLAVFGVDPVDAAGGPFGGDPVDYPSVTPELMPQITVPLGLLGETVNATGGGMGQPCAPAEDNFQQYYQYASSPALEIDVLGANHVSFLDDPNCGMTCSLCTAGTDDPAVTRHLTRRYMTAFFNVFVDGDEGYRTYLVGDEIAADVSAGLIATQNKNGL
jgi:dienelactone hydrolase